MIICITPFEYKKFSYITEFKICLISVNYFLTLIRYPKNISNAPDKDKYFTYSALVFNNLSDIENFKKDYKKILIDYFPNYFNTKEELKACYIIEDKNREKIYDCIINNNCKLITIIVDKFKTNRLQIIEENYKKSKKNKKTDRRKEYGVHKTYLIGQLICILLQKISKNREIKINIISDKETLFIKAPYKTIEEYFQVGQPLLKNYSNFNYIFKMKNSDNDYCLQGADFFANSVHKNYNKNDNKFYIYLSNRKKNKI